jgi:two-component system chemotaxis response regulator CheY
VLGYKDVEIVEVENGVDALSELNKQPFDLLITDITMPLMDGIELVKTVSQERQFSDMKVVVVSSAGNPAKEQELAQYGAQIIAKPISPAKLSKIVKPNQQNAWGG